LTTIETFYQTSGSSPPSVGAATDASTVSPDPPPLPPELLEDFARLLAEAIVADIRQYPNLAKLKAQPDSTVESPSGLNRRTRSARSRAAAPPGAPR
jgi:hypothetical protein